MSSEPSATLEWVDRAIDVNDESVQHGVAHLYSGGADSTFAAARLAEVFPRVYMNTFQRFGFLALQYPAVHVERLSKRFPDSEFVHQTIQAGKFYKEVEKYEFEANLKKHKSLVFASCGHCKTALHWRNLIFCLQKGIRYAADGAVLGAEQFAEQNPRILMPELADMYGHFGVTLIHPTWQEGLSTEDALYELGIIENPRLKMTTSERQVVCTQHIMFAMAMRVYLETHTFADYEKEAHDYLSGKVGHIKRLTEEWLANPKGDTAVSRMLS
jgi:hypothetical protein